MQECVCVRAHRHWTRAALAICWCRWASPIHSLIKAEAHWRSGRERNGRERRINLNATGLRREGRACHALTISVRLAPQGGAGMGTPAHWVHRGFGSRCRSRAREREIKVTLKSICAQTQNYKCGKFTHLCTHTITKTISFCDKTNRSYQEG